MLSLTHTDLDALFRAADPASPHPLCLSASPAGAWSLAPPPPTVPPPLPEPCAGINWARDGMGREDWAALLAAHSDAWLRGVAAFQGAVAGLDAGGRAALFARINEADTLFEEVRAAQQAWAGADGGAGAGAAASAGARMKERPPGRALALADITPALRGARAALFWPDSREWFPVLIFSVSPRGRTAKVQYETGEVETLDLEETIAADHLVLTG